MPRSELEELLAKTAIDVEDEGALAALAKQFKVSRATLQYRIRNLSKDGPAKRKA
jgi:DNA-binding Lrp family transcriptional regulator